MPSINELWRFGLLILLRTAVFVALLSLGFDTRAWGPHPEITQAALDVLGTNHPLAVRLGSSFPRLTNYCWLADYKRVPFPDATQDFYADDYLLFPQVSSHLDHICPEVKKSYAPYFFRALQALRTEDEANAARWIGSLIHFVEDTGSPPHAAEIRGGIHGKMENWVDARLVRIPGYQPIRLGSDDTNALAGLLTRMDGLIAFSRERGRKLRVPIEIGNRAAAQPIVLESALETARVVADLLHTLGTLPLTPAPGNCTVRGVFRGPAGAGLERFPGRVLLAKTDFSTIARPDGSFILEHLPKGNYELIAFRPGGPTIRTNIELRPDRSFAIEIAETNAHSTSLLRNADFQLRWVSSAAPDCWTRTPIGWEGEVIPLKRDQKYRLTVTFRPGGSGDVLLRWTRQLPYQVPNPAALPKIDAKPLTPANNTLAFTGTASMALLQVTLRTKDSPERLCENVQLVAED